MLDKLKDAGAVYESYSTPEEIDARNEANGRAKQLGYDNFDRDLTDEQKAPSVPRAASRPGDCACRMRTSRTSTSSAAR